MKNCIKVVYIYIVMNIFSCLLAQETANLKEWKEIECTVPDTMKCESIWGMEFDGEQFILDDSGDSRGSNLYQFIVSDAIEIKKVDISGISILPSNRGYFYDKNCLCGLLDSKHFWCSTQLHSKKRATNYTGKGIECKDGQCFLMNDKHYFLGNFVGSMRDKQYRLIQLAFEYYYEYTFYEDEAYYLDINENDPINIHSIVVLGNKIYYLSESGLCVGEIEKQVKNGILKTELLTEVTTQGENTLVTDKGNKIWIINSSDGVMEYDISNKTTKKIAEFPPVAINNGREISFDKVFFSANNNLYCITNKKVYTLKATDPDNPDPDNPSKLHDQSGKTCGFLGLEFIFILAGIFLFHFYRKH